MSLKAVLIYLLLFVPSLLLAAIIWSIAISGRLYYCWDSVPLLDFIPPFVHAGPPGSSVRDHYISAPWIVHATWTFFLAAALCIPLFITRRICSSIDAWRR